MGTDSDQVTTESVMLSFQEFSLTQDGSIQHLDLCITATGTISGSPLKLFQCRSDNYLQVSDLSFRATDVTVK